MHAIRLKKGNPCATFCCIHLIQFDTLLRGEIGVRPSRVGTKSFELEYELRANGRTVAEAKSVLVGYDYERAQSTRVPERWRRRLSG